MARLYFRVGGPCHCSFKKAHVDEEMKCETFAEGVYIVHVGGPIPMGGGDSICVPFVFVT